jgi:hypothetical protein
MFPVGEQDRASLKNQFRPGIGFPREKEIEFKTKATNRPEDTLIRNRRMGAYGTTPAARFGRLG